MLIKKLWLCLFVFLVFNIPVQAQPLSDVYLSLLSEKEVYNIDDTVKIGLMVSSYNMTQRAAFYLRFNEADNPYQELFNKFISFEGISEEMKPMVNEVFPLEFYSHMNCVEHPEEPCLFEFPASILGSGSYSLTVFLASPEDPEHTAFPADVSFTILSSSEEPINSTNIVGTWDVSAYDSNNNPYGTGTWTFNPDGTLEASITRSDGYREVGKGIWSLEGNNLKYKYTENWHYDNNGNLLNHCWVPEPIDQNWPNGVCDSGSAEFYEGSGIVEGTSSKFKMSQNNGFTLYFTRQ